MAILTGEDSTRRTLMSDASGKGNATASTATGGGWWKAARRGSISKDWGVADKRLGLQSNGFAATSMSKHGAMVSREN